MKQIEERNSKLAVKVFFTGLSSGLTKKEALNQFLFEDAEVKVSKIFTPKIDRLKWPKAKLEIVNYFKFRKNEWAPERDIIAYLDTVFNSSYNSKHGHIFRATNEHDLLEHDKENCVYRLKNYVNYNIKSVN